MISKEQANKQHVAVDAPEVMELLKQALNQFLTAAREQGFEAPLDVTVRDTDGDILREFTIERSGKLVKGRTSDANKLFVHPLTLFLQDAKGRCAILRVGEQIQFLN
jgi:hypothetical protein